MKEREQYDLAATVFSPEGRIYQVEYAREAVRRGSTSVGLKFESGVMILAYKHVMSRLIEPQSILKIFQLDRKIGCACSGLVADARILVERARQEAKAELIKHNEPITVRTLVRKICDLIRAYTQYGMVRPFGASLLIAGFGSNGAELFETDTSGALIEYNAGGIGRNRGDIMNFFEDNYAHNLSFEEALALAVEALQSLDDELELTAKNIDVGFVTKDEPFCVLTDEEIVDKIDL